MCKIKQVLQKKTCRTRQRDTVSAEISCFRDYGQGLALSLLNCPEIGRNHRQKLDLLTGGQEIKLAIP